MIVPVLLCGGSGTRLWPLSRQSYPKQFAPILQKQSLFQAAAARVDAPGFAPPVVVSAADFRFIVTEQLAALDIAPGAVLIEPVPRNTGPAILGAALCADPGALMLILPSDHAVADPAAFRAAVRAGEGAAQAGQIVTFGVTPSRAETGYGYLECRHRPAPGTATPLARFVEKPDRATAQTLASSGRHLWNAGIFLARADVLIAAFEAHAPGLMAPVSAAVAARARDLDFWRLGAAWAEAAPISVDYAVMERATNLSVVPFDGAWSDLGGWDAVWREAGAGVATSGPVTAIDSRDSLLRSESPGQELVALGVEGLIAVAMEDAVLVAPLERAQEVGQAVEALQAQGAPQATRARRDHRPWGWFETLTQGDGFAVKRIHVTPGGALSLQSHAHRAEHWVVVEGTAQVTIEGAVSQVAANQSIYVPQGARHRLENPSPGPVVLIEVQTGTYLGEDDITRYDDLYARD